MQQLNLYWTYNYAIQKNHHLYKNVDRKTKSKQLWVFANIKEIAMQNPPPPNYNFEIRKCSPTQEYPVQMYILTNNEEAEMTATEAENASNTDNLIF